jgi:hypothetical protein
MTMEDNHKATRRAMAVFIKENTPEGMRDYNKEDLEASLGTDDWYPSSIEYRRKISDDADAGVTLTVNDTLRWDYNTFEGEDGNTWKKMQYYFSVNWSSSSTLSCDQAGRYISLMSDILAFAVKLNEQFSEPCYKMVQTKEARLEAEENARKRKDKYDVQVAFDAYGTDIIKGQRVGRPPRLFKAKLAPTVSISTYTVERYGKEYEISNSIIIDDNSMSLCEIVRTK